MASSSPKELSEFYAFATNGQSQQPKTTENFWIVRSGEMRIQIYCPSSKRAWPMRGSSSALCFQQSQSGDPIKDINEWVTSLVSRGASVVDQPKFESFGIEAWMADPEGNKFLIVVSPTN